MIVGDLANCVSPYGLYPGQGDSDFDLELEKTILENKECEYIILSDLYGASVCTAMLRLTNLYNVKLFSGMNLNMVLEFLTRFYDALTYWILGKKVKTTMILISAMIICIVLVTIGVV
ncbi:hypothetical protein IR152_08080 [Clostridioides sp. ES-S-0108-01]|uniref:PTS sugar transporter subunit IIA n=1 Tax=Clostridioides sp. ES-S-0108-01 TaxID=2770773 RepID=UPI001D0C929D|nr:hypothetical protein [Clostridioides sp. ES-S-0108-01]UDN52036.1 hypothetical protein JJC16_05070 [Clostridioides sp. ES-S-0107-01]